jgi:hypothetical protein
VNEKTYTNKQTGSLRCRNFLKENIMKRTSLNIVVAIGIALTASSAIAADNAKFNPWEQVANVAHEYRSNSDVSGAIWASLERGFDKKTDFDSWNQLVNVAHGYNGGSGALWASFERGFDKDQNAIAVIADVAQPQKTAPVNALTQNVWTHHLISGVGLTTKI